jgi:hypothetical protein
METEGCCETEGSSEIVGTKETDGLVVGGDDG